MSVALGQLSPNTWRTLVRCYVLWRETRYPQMSWAKLILVYCIKKCPKTMSAYTNSTMLVLDNPNSDKH